MKMIQIEIKRIVSIENGITTDINEVIRIDGLITQTHKEQILDDLGIKID